MLLTYFKKSRKYILRCFRSARGSMFSSVITRTIKNISTELTECCFVAIEILKGIFQLIAFPLNSRKNKVTTSSPQHVLKLWHFTPLIFYNLVIRRCCYLVYSLTMVSRLIFLLNFYSGGKYLANFVSNKLEFVKSAIKKS